MKTILLFLAMSLPTFASTIYNFDPVCATNNNGNCDALSLQFSLTAMDNGGSTILFDLTNEADGLTSAISAVYFETVLAYSSFTTSPAASTSFSVGGSPSNPPGANPFTTAFYFTANPPPSQEGLTPGESMDVTVGENGTVGSTVEDTRVAIHVIGLSNGTSETMVFNYDQTLGIPSSVPEPTTLTLMGSALFVIGLVRARQLT